MTDTIEIHNLKKSFERKGANQLVLDIKSLKIQRNEFISLVGASGCGKTTLLNIIAGFLSFDSGSVNFFGKTDLSPSADRVCVFQEDAVFPWMNVRANVEYGLRRKKIDKNDREQIVSHYLKLVDLVGTEDHYPKELSGGMKKRVDLARAMANSPETILMDEPFGALDYRTRKELQNGLKSLLLKESKTIIFVTHDIEEALYLSDRIIILSQSPGSILSDIIVPFKQPREKSICDSPGFIKLRNKIEQTISNNEI